MAKGKVVLIAFPFDDLSATKVRPAVCLTEAIGPHRHVVLAFISSSLPQQLIESDIELSQSAAGFSQSGLKATSVLRLLKHEGFSQVPQLEGSETSKKAGVFG